MPAVPRRVENDSRASNIEAGRKRHAVYRSIQSSPTPPWARGFGNRDRSVALDAARDERLRDAAHRQRYDRTADFSSYHTFTWLARTHYGAGNPLIVGQARAAILSALEAKGYRYVRTLNAADFAVDFTIGAHQRLSVRAYPEPFAGPWSWYGPGWWGYPYWGIGVGVAQYREGTLSIDMFDARTHRPVWHGWARKPLSGADREHPRESIRTAVVAVLAKFPPP